MQTVTLSIFRFSRLRDRAWAFAQMGLARRHMRRLPGATFWKLMGAGTGEGFTPVPDTGAVAILVAWSDDAAAADGLRAPVFRRYAARAAEACTLHLAPVSARGRWSGVSPFRPLSHGSGAGPLAALTRATLRPTKALGFWRRVGDISRRVGQNDDVMFKVGVGEVPLLHQVTFSVWPDAEAMAAFARRSGPHAEAIAAVRDGDWFAEELYARFRVTGAEGIWRGRPLSDTFGALGQTMEPAA
jgi:spheroidene monooxygenase